MAHGGLTIALIPVMMLGGALYQKVANAYEPRVPLGKVIQIEQSATGCSSLSDFDQVILLQQTNPDQATGYLLAKTNMNQCHVFQPGEQAIVQSSLRHDNPEMLPTHAQSQDLICVRPMHDPNCYYAYDAALFPTTIRGK